VNESISRRAPVRLTTQLRGVMLAALAAALLAVTALAFSPPTALASTTRASTTPASATPASTASAQSAAAAARLRQTAWTFATRQIGKPYVWGGTGPFGFDCSGLVYAAYGAAGLMLPRTTTEMLASPLLIRIPKSQARRGDLAFFGTGHVELFDYGSWTLGAQHTGTLVGYHLMNVWWHPTMYFRVR
jgi:cell wall-associated NlpC family hydrolase